MVWNLRSKNRLNEPFDLKSNTMNLLNSNSFKVFVKKCYEVSELRFDLDINPIHHPTQFMINIKETP